MVAQKGRIALQIHVIIFSWRLMFVIMTLFAFFGYMIIIVLLVEFSFGWLNFRLEKHSWRERKYEQKKQRIYERKELIYEYL